MTRIAIAVAVAALVGCKSEKPVARLKPDRNPPPPDAPTPDAPPPPTPETKAQRVEVSFIEPDKPVAVDALVPVGWRRREGITTWDPPDALELPMWHRSFEIIATCDGGCTPRELEVTLPKYLDAIVARYKQPNMSGNAEQDAKAIAPVTELERGDLPQGGKFVLLRVEKPPAFASDPYPDIFAGACVTRRPTDEVMIVTRIQAAPEDEKVWWPVLVEACKATTIAR